MAFFLYDMIEVTILRHPKEKLAKCSLQPLVGLEGFTFYNAREGFTFNADKFTLLSPGAPVLSEKDAERPLLMLDSTWRLLPQLECCIEGSPLMRGLPDGIKTAYPRVSKIFKDPLGGLASVEALYIALKLMGEDRPELLNNYYWKDAFLEQFYSSDNMQLP